MRVPFGNDDWFRATFRRTEGDAPILFHIYLSAGKRSRPRLPSKNHERSYFRNAVLSQCVGRSGIAAVTTNSCSTVGIARAVYGRGRKFVDGRCSDRRAGLPVLVGFERRLVISFVDGAGFRATVENQQSCESRLDRWRPRPWPGGILRAIFGLL